MSANPHRRGILGLLGAAPIAAAANVATPAGRALGRLRPGFTGGFSEMQRADLYRWADAIRTEGLVPSDAEFEKLALALDTEPRATSQVARLVPASSEGAASERLAEARAVAALAVVFPPEIAAYRSFAPHLRRRLYAELLVRESQRVASGEPPPDPPATSDPGA